MILGLVKCIMRRFLVIDLVENNITIYIENLCSDIPNLLKP